MHHFDFDTFAALPAAKAKSAALAMFDAAMIEPAADWRGIAFALHAVISRKRIKATPGDTREIADASEFVAWADYAPTGKATAIARGRVTVTFADGWSKTVGMLAGKTAKGRKPWSIAHAVRFAVLCYKLAACRRATGSDAAMHFHRSGNAAGETVCLDRLISCPEIVSVISADSAETIAGDLVWNPCEANAFTRDLRAGLVDLATYQPTELGEDCALSLARRAILTDLGLYFSPAQKRMRALCREAADRVAALLEPAAPYSSPFDRADIWGVLQPIVDADPASYADAPAARSIEPDPAPDLRPVVSKSGDRWTFYRGGAEVDIADAWPDAVLLIGTSHRSRVYVTDASLARVSGLPYPQSGSVESITTLISRHSMKGRRVTGPRAAVKAYHAALAHYQACRQAHEMPAIEAYDPFLHDAEHYIGAHQRWHMMTDALFAFAEHGTVGGDQKLPAAALAA